MNTPEIKVDVRDAIRTARRANRDLSKSVIDAAVVSALNHTIAKARTAASRQIRSVYKIKNEVLVGSKKKGKKGALTIDKATRNKQTAILLAVGRPIGLVSFSPRQTRKGVSVNIMGKRRLLKGAFLATMKSGHKGVFARGEYLSGEFKWRKKRVKKRGNDNPITELKTTSVPTALSNDIVIKSLSAMLQTQFPNRLSHEIARRRT